MKKLLVLGGKPIGSYEIVEHAKSLGVYTIVTDYLPIDKSPAKVIADEAWNISTADVDVLKNKIIENDIDGIYSGVHEFNIEKMIALCEQLDMPCFCTSKQWKAVNNKRLFKTMCIESGIPVAKEYDVESIYECTAFEDIEYPVVVKPVDGSGSRGFSVCNNVQELYQGIENAKKFSSSGNVLIEQYMDYRNSAIINYTLIDGKIYFCGISDKVSKKVFDTGAPVMAVQHYMSKYQNEYVNTLDEKVKEMFLKNGLRNGVIWIEAFCKDGSFIFNEMGYRFGGSLTYLPVKHFYGVDQLDLQLQYALNNNYDDVPEFNQIRNDSYMILPIHVKPGTIGSIKGFDELQSRTEIKKVVYVHNIGDKISDWGSAQQVFAYLHIACSRIERTREIAQTILTQVSVKSTNGDELLFYLYED